MTERNLLQIALDVHMTNTGAMERHPDEQADDTKTLHLRLREWKEGLDRLRRFDDSVKNLIESVLLETVLAS